MPLALTRRRILAATLALPGIHARLAIASVAPDYLGPLPIPGKVEEGVNPPLPSEVAHAGDVIEAIPSGSDTTAYAIAQYFDQKVATHDKEGWPDRWNPVIVDFFRATALEPSGDGTPWCAAFVNWCLARSNAQGTRSASSGSFRNWHSTTTHPQPGDVVVFEDVKLKPARLGKGHVGFFVRQSGDLIYVLGGNQITSAGHHMIYMKALQAQGRILKLHSFRSMKN